MEPNQQPPATNTGAPAPALQQPPAQEAYVREIAEELKQFQEKTAERAPEPVRVPNPPPQMPQAPAPAPQPPVSELRNESVPESQVVQPHIPVLRTYRDDVVEAVRQGASIATAAVAEANRRAKEGKELVEEPAPNHTRRYLLIAGVATLLLAALSAGLYLFGGSSAPQAAPTVAGTPASFIFVDKKTPLPVDGKEGVSLTAYLKQKIDASGLQLGLIEQYFLTLGQGDAATLMSTQQFLSALGGAPSSLARALSPQFLFGVHIFNGNQPLLIFKTDSYDNAFAGMLAWENTMEQDLAPAFGQVLDAADRLPNATSTDAITTSSFQDLVLKNKDVRALKDRSGTIVLLYSFIAHDTLVITTNEYTLAEVVSRSEAARLP